MFKAIYGLWPGYLRNSFLPYNPVCPLQASERTFLWVPSPMEVNGMAIRSRALAAPTLWNSFHLTTINCFLLSGFLAGLEDIFYFHLVRLWLFNAVLKVFNYCFYGFVLFSALFANFLFSPDFQFGGVYTHRNLYWPYTYTEHIHKLIQTLSGDRKI